jgi:hypothetical protein
MLVLPISHFDWQVLRAVKRSKKPPVGRVLRLVPSRRTKDGSFLTDLVECGLLMHVTGSKDAPFEATYKLTEKGEYAAEHGECEMTMKRAIEPAKVEVPKPNNSQRRRTQK